jgi:alkyl sulfatase BDS1-like metallo-beta-lactamase superfamily hydrolase
VYELTDWGRELEQTVMSLGQWAARSPTPPSDAPIASADSVVLALRAHFDPSAAHGLRAAIALRLGEDRFRIEVADDALTAVRGEADHADATIETDPGTLDAVLWKGRSLADAQRSGELAIEGDKAAVKRFVRLFPMPDRG